MAVKTRYATWWIGGLGVLLLGVGGLMHLITPGLRTALSTLLLVGAFFVLFWVYLEFSTIRLALARRSTKYGLNTIVIILLLFGVIALVEALSFSHNRRWDLTEGQRYTLSDQTLKVLRSLKENVQVIAFFGADQPERRPAESLFRLYADLSPRFRYEFVDPNRQPARARRYGVSYKTVIVETGEKTEKITTVDEERLTNALIRVMRKGRPVVYFLQGHNEPKLLDRSQAGYSGAKEVVERANYEVKELFLTEEPTIPDDARVVVVSGPETDLQPKELEALKAYLDRGGSLLVFLDSFSAPSLVPFLAQYGIQLTDDLIVDLSSSVLGGDLLIAVVSTYFPHPITMDFAKTKNISVFPLARSVNVQDKLPAGVNAWKLAQTGEYKGVGSWAKLGQRARAVLEGGAPDFEDKKDRKGPIPIAAAARKNVQEGQAQARLAVYGSSRMINNSFLTFPGNKDFLVNSLNWLAQAEALIAIPPKQSKATPLFLTAVQANLIKWLPLFGIPGFILATGLGVQVWRRWSS